MPFTNIMIKAHELKVGMERSDMLKQVGKYIFLTLCVRYILMRMCVPVCMCVCGGGGGGVRGCVRG
jgi:hypothetical protein